jgi:hypothetical protein
MRRMLIVAVIVGAVVACALTFQARASSHSARVDRIGHLERQVAVLQRRMKALALISITHTNQILALQSRRLVASASPGGPAVIAPNSWGSANAGSCINGTAVSAGFSTDYPVEVGTVELSGGGWTVHAFNPNSVSTQLSTQVVCLTLR